MKKIVLYILVITAFKNYGQVTLCGSIYTDSSHLAISKVLVSIAELNLVTQTNDAGYYQLINIPKGHYTVLYKLLGYQTKVVPVNLKDTIETQNLFLTSSFLQYSEVVVYGTNRDRKSVV